MKSKRPLSVVIALTVAVVYFSYDALQRRNVALDDHEEYFYQMVEEKIRHYLRIGKSLARSGQLEDLKDHLEDAREISDIHFYILQSHGEPLFWGTASGEVDPIDVKYEVFDQMLGNDDIRFSSTDLGDGRILTIGANTRRDVYLERVFADTWMVLVNDVMVVVLLFIFIVAFYIRDIMQVVNQLRAGGRRSYRGIRSKSKESDIIIQSLTGYEDEVASLKAMNTAYGNQLLPSLKSELFSGKKPPYDFGCTMVRTDINNFSSIYHSHSVDDFMRVINEFFTEASHIIARYRGLVHEFVGDEVIFYFKDEHSPSSVQTALSAIRDINAAAERFNALTTSQYGYPFTVKSSLAYGTIRFGPLVRGYSLAGSVLIETVRILSHVVEKDGNVVCFEAANLSRVGEVIEVAEYSKVFLKGFSGERTLFRYVSHRPLAHVLETLSLETVDNICYYRSDEGLCATLQYLRKYSGALDEELVLRAIRALRGVIVTKSNGQVARELCTWLEELAADAELRGEGSNSQRVLSAACMLAMNLIPPDEFDATIEARLSRLLRVEDRRVIANVLDVLTYFKSEGDPRFVNELLRHQDNRILANALVHAGIRDLAPNIIRSLTRMLGSKDPALIASALYAVGEIASHHRSRDLVYYNAQVEFHSFVGLLPALALHANVMVRRQALIAARKCEEVEIIEKIRRHAEDMGESERVAEVAQYLGAANEVAQDRKAS